MTISMLCKGKTAWFDEDVGSHVSVSARFQRPTRDFLAPNTNVVFVFFNKFVLSHHTTTIPTAPEPDILHMKLFPFKATYYGLCHRSIHPLPILSCCRRPVRHRQLSIPMPVPSLADHLPVVMASSLIPMALS